VIEVRQLTKRYGGTLAVDELTFTVHPGRVTGFLGPNGAGKSTTMRMIMGLARPTHGAALVEGVRYARLHQPLHHVGALLEAKSAHSGRSAYHHLLCLAATHGIGPRRVREVLGTVGLADVAGKRAGTFSLGMGQRLGLAAALLGDPPVLVLDEPVNGLDPEGIRWIRAMLRRWADEGRTVFVSSHGLSEMSQTADHLVVVGRGRLLADLSTPEFIARNCRPVVRVRTTQPDRLAEALTLGGTVVTREPDGALVAENIEASAVGRAAAEHGVVLDELSSHTASLEDAFLRLTSREQS
jgi:ABC-2 type transport system ATP-binding protein